MGVFTGTFVEKAVLNEVVDGDAVKEYSVELTVDAIYRNKGRGVVGVEDSYREDLTEVPPHSRYEFKQRGKQQADSLLREYGVGPRNRDRHFYWLDDSRTYTVEFEEDYDIPENHVAVLYPKETLTRLGATLFTGVQEPDEESHTALLYVDGAAMIEDDSRIARLVVYEGVS